MRCVAGDRVCAGTNLDPKPIMKGFSATGGFDCVQFATLQHAGGIYIGVSRVFLEGHGPGVPRLLFLYFGCSGPARWRGITPPPARQSWCVLFRHPSPR